MADRPGLVGMTMLAAAVVLAAAIMVPTSARQDDEPRLSVPDRVERLEMVALAPDEQAASPADRRPDQLQDRGRRARRGLSPVLIERCLEVAREVDPALADRLEEIRRERPPEKFAQAIRDAHHLRRLVVLKDEDPQLYDVKVKELQLDAQADRLLEQLAEARRMSSGVAGELEAQLHGLVELQVAYSLAARGMYLRRLNEHAKTLREQLEHDLGHFRIAVDRRMKRVLQDLEEGAVPGAPEG